MRTTTTFNDIHDAFLFVSSDSYGMNSATLCKDTGKIYYRSEMAGIDDAESEDIDWTNSVDIPHKNDLDLGKSLFLEFVDKYLPKDYYHVEQIFRARGAYGRFKRLLEDKGLLQTWYDFENQREEEAPREWCEENEIEFSE